MDRIGLQYAAMDLLVGAVIAAGGFLLGAVIRPYLKGYSTKKGENLATQEDAQRILDQVQAVTRSTEEIKSEISGGLWDKQKQWEMKREVLFEATNAVARVEEQLMRMSSVIAVGWGHIEDPDWIESWHETLSEWREAVTGFEKALSLVLVTCAYETAAVLVKFRSLVGGVSGRLAKKDRSVYDERSEEITRAALEVRVAIRKELGVPTPQSTQSSAPLSPNE